MPTGILINLCGVLLGCLLGSLLGRLLREELRRSLTTTFGFCALTIGVTLIVRIGNLAPAVLSLVLGTLTGELLRLQDRVNRGVCAVSEKLLGSSRGEAYLQEFRAVAVLFCFSGTGLVGAMTEGFTGDHTLLLAKAVMDFFTAIIFSSLLGGLIAIICVPQAVVMFAMFALSHLLMPVFDTVILGNFYAVGGVISLMAGFNMLKLRDVHTINALPALVLVPILTALWPL